MTRNRFGGQWTADKLQVLEEYLDFYTLALRDQPSAQRPFELVYVDAFAGTGRCHIRDGTAAGTMIAGSALRALDTRHPFARYHFIEKKRKHQAELQALLAAHPLGPRCTLHRGNAVEVLPQVLAGHDWRRTRGVLFLDPFGLQCDWAVLQQVAATRALDVFFLLSLSGLYRQAAVDARGVDAGKAARLDAVLGTAAWRTALYTEQQGDLFGPDLITRPPGWEPLLQFASKQLRELFPHVSHPRLLGQSNGAPLFALFFMVSNHHGAALTLARRVSDQILSKLR